MNSNHFKVQIILRLLAITLLIGVLLYFAFVEPNYIRVIFLAAMIILVLLNLFNYINATNRETANFLIAILNDDFSNKYSKTSRGRTFSQLYDTFNLINKRMVNLSVEREAQFQYLNTLINQINVGILSFDRSENILLINPPFKRLMGIEHLVRLNGLQSIDEHLYEVIRDISSGNTELVKLSGGQGTRLLSIGASEFILREKQYKLISMQDIKGELEQNEMEAWQKLIRVLTHEIMNSVSPITSLSTTMHQMMVDLKGSVPDGHQIQNLISGLEAIKERGAGLMRFTKDYRSLTRIPKPNIRPTVVEDYFEHVRMLFLSTLKDTEVQFDVDLQKAPPVIHIDPDLFNQVLINLLQNALEAVVESGTQDGKIELNVSAAAPDRSEIVIRDNGIGIAEEILDKIFIPFYTAKEGGSGVGLSVVKQIIHLHGGQIEVDSSENSTVFRLKL